MTAKWIISIAYIGAVATPYRRNSGTLSTMYTLLAGIMVRCVQDQSFLLIVAASTKLRIFSNPLASLYDGIEVPPIQMWKLHPMNVSAIHVAQLCWIIHPRCIRNRYSPLRDHLAQRIQPLVLKVPNTVALKWSDSSISLGFSGRAIRTTGPISCEKHSHSSPPRLLSASLLCHLLHTMRK